MENNQTYFTKNEALEDIKEILESYNGCYCDLHDQVFNSDYYIIGNEAIQDLYEYSETFLENENSSATVENSDKIIQDINELLQ